MSKRPITVLGVTGRQGGSVARALLDAGWPVRGVVRNPASEAAVRLAEAGAEIVTASLSEDEALRAAIRSSHGVFSVLPGNLPADGEIDRGMRIAAIAAEEGVGHFVYSSGASVGEQPTGVARFDAKPRIEAFVQGLPIRWTIIRPMIFMDMMLGPSSGLSEGRLVSLVRPEQAMQLVATADIGRVVASIFADGPRYDAATLKLASDTLTGRQIAAAVADAAGRPLVYSRVPQAVLDANPDLGHIAASLENGPLSLHADLEALGRMGAKPTSFREWLAGEDGRHALGRALGEG